MTVISKYNFYQKLPNNINCKGLIHPQSDDCLKMLYILIFRRSVIGGALKFFAPIYILRLICAKRKVDKDFVINLIKSYFRSVLFAMCLGSGAFSNICMLSKLTNHVYYYCYGLLPGFFAGGSIFLESKENCQFFSLLFFNMVIESVFRNLDSFNVFKLTRTRQIIIFMIINSLLMRELSKIRHKHMQPKLWVFLPNFPEISNEKTQCYHHIDQQNKSYCWLYCLQGVGKYFLTGYSINTIKTLIPEMNKLMTTPKLIFKHLFKRNHVKFGLFLSSYIGLFRIISCYLYGYSNRNIPLTATIAGFLSGISIAIKPNINTIALAVTTLLQVYCFKFKKLIKYRQKLPLNQLLFMISNSILLHNRLLAAETCPKYYAYATDICTKFFIDSTVKRLDKLYFAC